MCLNPLFQNQCLLFLLSPLCQRISQPPGQDQKNGKGTSFRINFKDISTNISIVLSGLYLSPGYLSNFHSELYIPPWLGKIFKFMLFSLLENAFMRQKLNLDIFSHGPETKFSRFFSSANRHRQINHFC